MLIPTHLLAKPIVSTVPNRRKKVPFLILTLSKQVKQPVKRASVWLWGNGPRGGPGRFKRKAARGHTKLDSLAWGLPPGSQTRRGPLLQGLLLS